MMEQTDSLADILGGIANAANAAKLQLTANTQNQAAAVPPAGNGTGPGMPTTDFVNFLLLGIAGAAIIGAMS